MVTGSAIVQQRLGVGITAPAFPVQVDANVDGISVNCSAKVVATEFSVYSDARIKTAVARKPVGEYLDALARLPVVEFAYKDAHDKGAGSRVGFLAQEVEAVLPSCVETVKEYIPNVFAALPVVAADAQEVTLDVAALSDAARALLVEGAWVKVRSGAADGTSARAQVTGVDSAGGEVRLAFQDPVPAAAEDGTMFVVGTLIHDFKMLNHERLASIAIGAIQAQNTRLAALEATVAALQQPAAPRRRRAAAS